MIESLRFFAAMRRSFRTVGAIAPSSSSLAKSMVRRLGPLQPDQVVIELGPGTGPITKWIRNLYPHNPLIAVEFDPNMAQRLQRRFPEVRVVHGCASRLADHVHEAGFSLEQVGGVISGLPVLNLPSDLRDAVFEATAAVLPEGRSYVQFTYSKHRWRNIHPPGFKLNGSKRIFMNVPPAVVLPFVRDGELQTAQDQLLRAGA